MAKRRKRLRSLIHKEALEPRKSNNVRKYIFIVFSLLSAAIAVGLAMNTNVVWSDFLTTYQNQYNQIVHGEENYCLPVMDVAKLFSAISNEVLNQQAALSSMELQLRNDSKFTAIAVVGTTGVGKSLFAQSLKKHFPWQENIQTYSWFGYHTLYRKEEDVKMFLNHLSRCGRNLIIIDNLGTHDIVFVQEYNKYSKEYAEKSSVNLIVVYVFNLAAYTEEQRKQVTAKIESLGELKDVTVVRFRELDSHDLKECIRHEAKSLNLTLDNDDFEEVVNSIDAGRSGCKSVRSKVLMYGKDA